MLGTVGWSAQSLRISVGVYLRPGSSTTVGETDISQSETDISQSESDISQSETKISQAERAQAPLPLCKHTRCVCMAYRTGMPACIHILSYLTGRVAW